MALTENEKIIRFDALKYYLSGQGEMSFEQLKIRVDDFIDGTEEQQIIRLKEFVENKMLQEKIDWIATIEANTASLDREKIELEWMQNYIAE